MVSKNVKMEAPSVLNGNPSSQKEPAAEGVALKIIENIFNSLLEDLPVEARWTWPQLVT